MTERTPKSTDMLDARDALPTPVASDTGTARSETSSFRDSQLSALQCEVGRLRAELAAANLRERTLKHELQHRVRNMLAVIRTIYRRMLASHVVEEDFAPHFEDRLDAIGRYQIDIAGQLPGGIELEDMVRDELLIVHCSDGPDCTISGPSVRLSAKWGELMGLTLHELAVNAVKFGALAHGGTLLVEWSVIKEEAQSILRLHWQETGVPMVTSTPRKRGFGHDLIEEALPYQFGATTSLSFRPGGIDCQILLPLPPSNDSATVAWQESPSEHDRSDVDDIA